MFGYDHYSQHNQDANRRTKEGCKGCIYEDPNLDRSQIIDNPCDDCFNFGTQYNTRHVPKGGKSMNRKQALNDVLNRRELSGIYMKPGFSDWLEDNGFFVAPASISHHGNVEGGLFDHSLTVMETLVTLTNRNQLDWSRPASPFIVGLFHDLCKMDDYVVVMDDPGQELFGGEIVGRTYVFDHNPAPILTGHGEKSILMLAPWIGLTEEEIQCIRWHMGAFDEKANWNRYGAAVEKWPNVLWTHQADMIAARIMGV